MKTLLIVDGNNIAYRANHTHSLTNKKGEDIGILYGFTKMLKSYITRFDVTAAIVCWDHSLPRFRRERVPSYKANRVKTGEDLIDREIMYAQMDKLHEEVLPSLGVMSVRRYGIEADDLAYHAAVMAHEQYDQVIVVSADMDLLQCALIADNVCVYNPNNKKHTLYGVNHIQKEYGIKPTHLVHWRAIQGDSSDNIKGVMGIGPKTATKLFVEFDSLISIWNAACGDTAIGKISDSMAAKIRTFGLASITDNVFIMVLAFDRTGARLCLWDAGWSEFNKAVAKRFFLSQDFISLATPTVYNTFKALEYPEFTDKMMRMPVIAPYRKPTL